MSRKAYIYKNIKVKPETFKRLREYQAFMTKQSEVAETYSMDQVICALLDLIELSVKIKKPKERAETSNI